MKYKVGDKVRIRKDLKVGELYGKVYFVKSMGKYVGKTAKITRINLISYKINLDGEDFCWSDEMLEKEKNINPEFVVKKGDIITFNDNEDVRVEILDCCRVKNLHLKLEDITKVERPVSQSRNKVIFGREEPKEILDEVEKEYLRAVIKPFRKEIAYIVKRPVVEEAYISIVLSHNGETESIVFPNFQISKMYIGMESNKGYTLEMLGL